MECEHPSPNVQVPSPVPKELPPSHAADTGYAHPWKERAGARGLHGPGKQLQVAGTARGYGLAGREQAYPPWRRWYGLRRASRAMSRVWV